MWQSPLGKVVYLKLDSAQTLFELECENCSENSLLYQQTYIVLLTELHRWLLIVMQSDRIIYLVVQKDIYTLSWNGITQN